LNCFFPCGCEGTDYNFLPDGLYTITVKGSPDIFNKTLQYLRTNQTRLELDKMYVDLKLTCEQINESKLANIRIVETYLTAAEASVRLGLISDAQDLFHSAQGYMEMCKRKKGCK